MAVPSARLPSQNATSDELTKKQRPRIYQLVLIAVRQPCRIMPVPAAVLTKAVPLFQQMRINAQFCEIFQVCHNPLPVMGVAFMPI